MAISSQSPQSPPPVKKVHGMFHNLIELVASSVPEPRKSDLRSSSSPKPPPTNGPRPEQWQSSPQISHTLSTWTKYTQILIHMYNADISDPENHGAILHHKQNLPEWKGWDVYDAATVRCDKNRLKLQVLREFCERLAAAKAGHTFRQAIRAAQEVRMPFSPQSTSELLEREDELMDELYPGFADSDEAEMYGRWIEASTIDEGDATMCGGQSGVRVRQRGDEFKAFHSFIPGQTLSEQVTTYTENRPTLVDIRTPKLLIPRITPVNFSIPQNYPQNYPASPPTQATNSNHYLGGRPSDFILHQTPEFTLTYQPTPSPLHHTPLRNSFPQTTCPSAPHLVAADRGISPLGSHPPPMMVGTSSPHAMPPAQYQPQMLMMGDSSHRLPLSRSQRYKEDRPRRYQQQQQQQQQQQTKQQQHTQRRTHQAQTKGTVSPGGTHYYTPVPATTASDNPTVKGNAQSYAPPRSQPQ